MTIAITLLLSSLLIIGILRTVRESRGESPAEQVTESPVQTEKISEVLPEPQAEIIVENPPYQAEEKKAVQKKPATAKKTPAKKAPAKKTTSKK
jgi:tRNA1(Val) A37 N6-methylase TrmN6